ncbi:MAG: MFS transporter [Burkholderiales bacterium]|nr:MFS transporter [Burkholderiales bacterium]
MSFPPRFVTLAVLASTLALVYGIWYSYGVFMVALLREFGWSRSVLAGAFSVFTLTHGVASPVVGWLCGRIDPPRIVCLASVFHGAALWASSYIAAPWQLYLGFGLATAFAGAASGWVPALVQAQRRFPDRLGLALGIVSSGVGVGMLIMVPLCQLLIDAYGWRIAFRVLGVASAGLILPAALYLVRTSPARQAAASAQRSLDCAVVDRRAGRGSGLSLREATGTPAFWLLIAAFLFGNICAQTLHVHQVVYLVDHGLAAIVAASVVSVVGAASIVAKIVAGWVSDLIDREIVYVACILIMVAAVGALAAVGAWPSRWGAYGYAVLLGVGYSVTASVTPALASDRFSGPHFGAIVGVGLLAAAVGSALGPWLAGWLFDRTGSYAVPLWILVACGGVAAAAGWKMRQLRLRGASARRPGAAN